MDPRIIEIGAAVVALGAWLGVYGLLLFATRPRLLRAQAATPDLGAEPPAVVSLLVNGWELNDDAAESTLLDLAARRILELRQPGTDPRQTTVHIVQTQPSGLNPYEQRVFNRVSSVAVNGVVPLTALTFRDQAEAKSWSKRLRTAVIADARARGLSRRRFGKALVTSLSAIGAGVGIVVGVATYHYLVRANNDDPSGGGLSAGFVTFLLLTGLASRAMGERDTPAGQEAAAQWLGVQAWLRGHEEFAELPPAAVTVWDRYLSYGAALGVTRVCGAVIDLGMGNRKQIWSSFGGTWHQVRVRYPFGVRYGATSPRLLLTAVIYGAVGYVLLRLLEPFSRLGFALVPASALILGILLLGRSVYSLVRMASDLAAPSTRTGQVLWLEVWQTTSKNGSDSTEPATYYLVVDDGTGERTTAWALPVAMHGQCRVRDTVTITARPWSRRILTVTVVEATTPAPVDDSAPESVEQLDERGNVIVKPVTERPALMAAPLTAAEVSQALGLAVTSPDGPVLGPIPLRFTTVEGKRVVLMVQVAGGPVGRLAWRTNAHGDALPGTGDGAFRRGDRATAKVGDTIVLLTLMGPAKGQHHVLPGLLRQAVARVQDAGGQAAH